MIIYWLESCLRFSLKILALSIICKGPFTLKFAKLDWNVSTILRLQNIFYCFWWAEWWWVCMGHFRTVHVNLATSCCVIAFSGWQVASLPSLAVTTWLPKINSHLELCIITEVTGGILSRKFYGLIFYCLRQVHENTYTEKMENVETKDESNHPNLDTYSMVVVVVDQSI